MRITTLLFILLLGVGLSSADLTAQYVLIDFMYVPEGGENTYVQMERSYAKPVHQELINQGKLDYWGLFRVAYPAGTGADYHYVTVRSYKDAEQLANATAFLPTFEKIHENEILEAITATVFNTRDLVETHRLDQWKMVQADDVEEHPEILQVSYLKVDMPNWDSYQQMENQVYLPMHKKEMEMGHRAGWQAFQLSSPMGSSMPYSHITVDLYKDWTQYTQKVDKNMIRKAVHANKKQGDLDEQLHQTVNISKVEEWHLVDYVMKEN